MSTSPEDELVSLLRPDIDPKLKASALEYILGLTATKDGLALLLKDDRFLKVLTTLLASDDDLLLNPVLKCFINITALDSAVAQLVEIDFIAVLLALIGRSESVTSMSIINLSNVTRQEEASEVVLKKLGDIGGLEKLVELLCTGMPHSSYHYCASVLSNLTQLSKGRELLLDKKASLLKRLLPFTTYMESQVRRSGIVGAIRNCCFDTQYHDLLLDESLNLLPTLVLPLAGPEEFDDDEMEKLPLELQYLEEDKQRDPNPEIRQMLIEALTQLCAKKEGRHTLRDKNVYVILRELHKWEKTPTVVVACENLVDILIGDEPQPGMENLKEVDIPQDMVEKFRQMDQELLDIS